MVRKGVKGWAGKSIVLQAEAKEEDDIGRQKGRHGNQRAPI